MPLWPYGWGGFFILLEFCFTHLLYAVMGVRVVMMDYVLFGKRTLSVRKIVVSAQE